MSFPAPPERTALPVQPSTVIVFAPAFPVRLTLSMPASRSVPRPASPVAVSVKSTFPDSVTVSEPLPPSRLSFPPRPESVSSPATPESVLPRAFPWSVSANAVPVTFSIPVVLESVSVSPEPTAWAAVTARSMLTPPLNRFEKSSVSLSVFAASTIVTLADSIPLNI